jgi:mycofactocin radical SAM maturase
MKDELSTGECLALVDELARIKVFQINIGGGEPFLRPDIFEVLEYAQGLGLVCCVSTNGTVFDASSCARLSDMDNLYLQVSLDGADEIANDAIRGKGTYARILKGIELLAGRGVPFSINTVLTALSYPQIDALKNIARDVGAGLRISRFRPAGRGKRCVEELGPTREQMEGFAQWLERDPDVLTGDSFFSVASENRRRMGLDMCGAAKMTCCVSPSGSVYPCAFLQEADFLAGNVRETPLGTIWRQAQIFGTFRRMEVKSCETCYRFDSCRGGCPAMAYHKYGRLGFPDPECIVQCLGVSGH